MIILRFCKTARRNGQIKGSVIEKKKEKRRKDKHNEDTRTEKNFKIFVKSNE